MTEWLWDVFIAPMREGFFLKSLLGGSIVAVTSGVVGCLVILRRMAFLGDALSHAMIAGIGGGYLVMKLLFGLEAHAGGMLLGSFIAAVVTVALIGFVSSVSRIKQDTAIGIMYCGIFAAGVVLVSVFSDYIHIDLIHFIMGDVLGVSDDDLWAAAVASSIALSVIILFFRHFQITTFDPVMAGALGFSVLLIEYALTICVSLVVVSAISMVGVILVVGLLITPAATAYLLTDRLGRMMALAAVFGITSVVGGLYLCVWLNSSGGGAIMLFCTLQFLAVLTVAPRYGLLAKWLRKRRMVPQQLLEDILRAVLKSKEPLTADRLSSYVEDRAQRLPRAVGVLKEDGMIEVDGRALRLTEKGRQAAIQVQRAHRVWESYLAHVGLPETQLHPQAHKLEHITERRTVDYLDGVVGYPARDPHGAPIPEDPELRRSEREASLSLVRETGRVRVVRIDKPALAPGLNAGEVVSVATSHDDNVRRWELRREDGSVLTLEQSAAESITVTRE